MSPRSLSFVLTLLLNFAVADAGVVLVTPTSPGPWHFNDGPFSCGGPGTTGSVAFVSGPGTPPLGTGSLLLEIGTGGDFLVNRSDALDGVLLRDLTDLYYSTFINSANFLPTFHQAPRLYLLVDVNGDGSQFQQLLFEPTFQNGLHPGDLVPNQGAVMIGTWQTWDAVAGGWWDFLPSPNPALIKLSTFAAAHPAAVIRGNGQVGLALLAGCDTGDSTGFSANVDAVSVGVRGSVTTDDFEPSAIPTLSPSMLVALGAMLLGAGLLMLRR